MLPRIVVVPCSRQVWYKISAVLNSGYCYFFPSSSAAPCSLPRASSSPLAHFPFPPSLIPTPYFLPAGSVRFNLSLVLPFYSVLSPQAPVSPLLHALPRWSAMCYAVSTHLRILQSHFPQNKTGFWVLTSPLKKPVQRDLPPVIGCFRCA